MKPNTQADIGTMLTHLADLNAALQVNAQKHCGTRLTEADDRRLDEMHLARSAVLSWLSDKGVWFDVGSNVYRTPKRFIEKVPSLFDDRKKPR